MMKHWTLTLIIFALNIVLAFGQEKLRIDNLGGEWASGTDGYICLDLKGTGFQSSLPDEFTNTPFFSIFNVPFKINNDKAQSLSTSVEGVEEIEIIAPQGSHELLFVMVADFPKDEIAGCWDYKTPLTILSEPERAEISLIYSDGEVDDMLPVNADYKCYGITHGRALYSVVAKKGKSISKMIFKDKMKNASFQIIAATANKRIMPRIAAPNNTNLWYPEVKNVALSDASFSFDTKNGFSWKTIESEMLPENINITEQPVFMIVCADQKIPSTEWNVSNVAAKGDTTVYTIIYNQGNFSLRAILKSFKSKKNEISLTLDVTNLGKNKVKGQLFFPLLSNLKIGSVANTWYAYSRNGLIVNKINCSYHDYLGCEKPLQFDGIFNPDAGVGLGIFPRDTSDFFRWYSFSKDDNGVNYGLEYTPVVKNINESWKSIPVALAIIPGDWKNQFTEYKNWVNTWYKKSTPELDWFKQVFAFAYFDNGQHGDLTFSQGAQEFKERFGYLDYFHIFGWAKTEKYGHWGDYSHYESVGGKKTFVSTINQFQKEKNIPVGLYLDGYLITDQSINLSNEKKLEWAIKQQDGKPFHDYNSYVECMYAKPWRDYLIERYREVYKTTGAKGMYCDELGMSLRSRICYDSTHGHPVPAYMAAGENLMMKELKAAFPDVAIYNEFGGTDVMTQYTDGGLSYITAWNYYSPEQFNVTGNVPYSEIAPQYLDLRRFAFPHLKTFDVALTQVPWRNGNWSIGKFGFFNGNAYFHRVDEGKNADEEALKMMRKIRELQNEYKLEFSSSNLEPFVPTLSTNIFSNRFSTENRDVYTLFNANYRTAEGGLIKVRHKEGTTYKDVWNNREVKIISTSNGFATLHLTMPPRSVTCIVTNR